MNRIILVYGVLAGLICIFFIALDIVLQADSGGGSVWLGYLIMLAALSLVFAGVKRYRDIERGGVVRFWNAAGVGLGIALVSGIIYVMGWEAYLWATDYSFFPDYAKSVIDAKRASGASAAEIAQLTREMTEMGKNYARLPYRAIMTLVEILPVGVFMSLVSAALLRNTGFLPYRGARQTDG